ncbi:glycosyltransferase family 2 protein [Paraglaciecola aestuariivivens]
MNKPIAKHLMLAVKSLVGLLPKQTRVKMRQHLWLHNLYSKSLKKSGLFYGFPSPRKLQQLYVKNMAWQQQKMAILTQASAQPANIQCLVILSGHLSMDQATLRHLCERFPTGEIYILGQERAVEPISVNPEFSGRVTLFSTEACKQIHSSLLVLRSGDYLHDKAIEMFALASASENHPSVAYCDIDRLNEQGERYLAEFYPDWNPDLQLSTGYIKTAVLLKGEQLILNFCEFAQSHFHPSVVALWLAKLYVQQNAIAIEHFPFCLVHQKHQYDYLWPQQLAAIALPNIQVVPSKMPSVAKVSWHQTDQPLVSLIIPTKNAKSLVKTCIDSILSKTTYPNYEILLIDNNSDEPESLAYFASLDELEPKVRLLKYPHAFNYSAINNFAVGHAKGEVLALVNNDIEVITPSWLTDMLGHVLRQDIGCVGAKLLYPDDRIQHAGVVLGYGGGAGHAHKYFPKDHAGYAKRLAATNNFSAVTAACLLVKKSDFEQVGGLNEKHLSVAFNDVDFCLKVLKLGRRNLYCAEAELYHHESVSRGDEDTQEKRSRFQSELDYLQLNWSQYIQQDPAYNPNLTLHRENFAIAELKE